MPCIGSSGKRKREADIGLSDDKSEVMMAKHESQHEADTNTNTDTDTDTGTDSNVPTNIQKLNLLLDPAKATDREKKLNESRKMYEENFGNLDLSSSYESLFEILWYSQLPCFDIKEVTSSAPDQMSVVKKCFWKGLQISCSAIFRTLPTDR